MKDETVKALGAERERIAAIIRSGADCDERGNASLVDSLLDLIEAPVVKPCARCAIQRLYGGHGPSHNGSRLCRQGYSIASGGGEAHCTCAACF